MQKESQKPAKLAIFKTRKSVRIALAMSVLLVQVNCYPYLPAFADGLPVPVVPSVVLKSSTSKLNLNLNIAEGSTHVIDVSNGPIHRLSGSLSNKGTLYIVSTNPHIDNATLIARNIFNYQGASISTVLPSGGLAGFDSAIPNLSLTLAAIRNIVNNGSISSAHDLNLLAGGSITNAPVAGALASAASLQAANNLNLLSSAIANHGVITAQLGNVNIANTSLYTATVNQLVLTMPSALKNIININNTAGVIQALNGMVNIGSSGLSNKTRLSIWGGALTAPEINLNAGAGILKALFDKTNGTLNVQAGEAQVGTSQSVLNLGTLCVNGDPTFYNDGGDINITGDISVKENLAILAKGNITSAGQFKIKTRDDNFLAHDVFMVAGADIQVSGTASATPNVNSLTPGIPAGTKVSVSGASFTGGSISLADSMIDTKSSGINQDGGNVTLVAYAGSIVPLGGGIENLYVQTGGTGTGKNGSINIIAGGSILLSNNAVNNVQVLAAGGGSKLGAPINIYAAAPTGSATFDSKGNITGGGFGFGNPTAKDIQINRLVASEGGDIMVIAGGNISVAANAVPGDAQINSGGFVSGNGIAAGNITVTSNAVLDIQGIISASGSSGANGLAGQPGLPGKVGLAGGGGGLIALTGDKGITINNNILANGGAGGAGGKGGDGGKAGQSGGNGAVGGAGGRAGSISFTTTDTPITLTGGFTLSARGGTGGVGGNGGNGFISGILSPAGQDGGSGGGAGIGGAGGGISAISGKGDVSFSGSVDARGGSGADGGLGRDGVAGKTRGGDGGAGGGGSDGGRGGSIDINTKGGNIVLNTSDLSGGAGGMAALSGAGAAGNIGGDGGLINKSGSGGAGGRISISAMTGSVTFQTDINLAGGAGASMLNSAGAGADGISMGGKGGFTLGSGKGGDGGKLTVLSSSAITVDAPISTFGGVGGTVAASGGKGGSGLTGNAGGKAGESGDGGSGSAVSLTSDGDININFSIDTSGNSGGTQSGSGGDGGTGSSKNGGAGGGVDVGGDGGNAGEIKISSKGNVTIKANLLARGGAGSLHFGSAGDGGTGVATKGGAGGSVLVAGKGGDGGRISVEAGHDITVFNSPLVTLFVDSSGGTGGAQQGIGGAGATGNNGGAGGSVGDSGKGGAGKDISFKTTQTSGPGLVTIDYSNVFANGGKAGLYEGRGGNGGDGLAGDGGAGGSLNNQGDAGNAGNIFFTGLDFNLTPTGFIYAKGGATPGFEATLGSSGNGGNAGGAKTSGADGGFAGKVGNAGDGGKGGQIQINMKNTISIDNGNSTALDDSISTRGGSVGDNNARSGAGGDAGPFAGKGGFGGQIGNNGSGGDAGDIIIIGDKGDVTGGSGFAILAAVGGFVGNVFSKSGAGGNGSTNGNGGDGGKILNNGNGGDAGSIKISTGDGAIILSPFIATGGDINGVWSPSSGAGGSGGTISSSGNGGSSGSIGDNGKGGKGGAISLSTKADAATVLADPTRGTIGKPGNVAADWITYGGTVNFLNFASPTTGDGGDALGSGKGGASGAIGGNGKGGDGGQVYISSNAGLIFTPKGGIGAGGADAGATIALTGNGGNANGGNAGVSGAIGINGSGGAGGQVVIISMSGDISLVGFINAPGGSARGNLAKTGNGGTSIDGAGGKSGAIGQGGDGGKGGTLLIQTGGNIDSGEFVSVVGGSAAATAYAPVTGNGGDGGAAGGDSGTIGAAGTAGNGGYAEMKANGNINIDRVLADGGYSGTIFGAVSMQGRSGDGGKGGTSGGKAGRVGDAVKGGGGGEIVIYADKSAKTTVQFGVRGGDGGVQKGIGGKGGDGENSGGKGGEVGLGGNGGDAGKITLTANIGPNLGIRSLLGYGGAGGGNFGEGGDGGNCNTVGAAGDGGAVGKAGEGGKGASKISASIINLALDPGVEILDTADIGGLIPDVPYFLFGGAGGIQSGSSGEGGNGLGSTTGKKNTTGGDGGMVGRSGNGGDGGTLEFSVPAGSLTLFDCNLNGGASGAYNATSGSGGYGSGTGASGKGGDGGLLDNQGDGGKGGNLTFSGGSMLIEPNSTSGPTPGPVIVTLNGGDATTFKASSGSGGKGGGNGGVGGQIGKAGGGGGGGKIDFKADGPIVITNGTLTLNGGKRTSVEASSGSGADGGRSSLLGNGGNGGAILLSGDAGAGGTVSIESKANYTATGILQANGGSSLGVTFTSGNGGSVFIDKLAGKGGAIGSGGGGGMGGSVSISTSDNLQFTTVEATGGSAGNYVATSGKGGNGGTAAGSFGGLGGEIMGNGSGAIGGTVTLTTASLPTNTGGIIANTITVTGGSIGTLTATSGNGGDASETGKNAAGGGGGAIKNSGAAGDGGTIDLKSNGAVSGMLLPTDLWDASGGSVGAFNATSGNGGKAAPAATGSKIGSAGGGAGGAIGKNSSAGSGGTIKIDIQSKTSISLAGNLSANGGDVGVYQAKSGDGGTGFIGGDGGSIDDNGNAGSGGTIVLSTAKNSISTQALSAKAGTTGDYMPQSGKGATAPQTGGGGGPIGNSGSGGGGGKISLVTLGSGDVTVNGDMTATGSAGGTNAGLGGDAADGVNKGGKGADIGVSGAGGAGGSVELKTVGGNVSVNGTIDASKGAGGFQMGKAGKAGNATTASVAGDTGTGGAGGNIGKSGAGGSVGINPGSIAIESTNGNVTVTGSILANGLHGGNSKGIATDGGTGSRQGGAGGTLAGTGVGAKGGDISVKASNGAINITGAISANGGNGGTQNLLGIGNQAVVGNGGNATTTAPNVGIGGDAGSVGATGVGGDGGTILIKSPSRTNPTPTAAGGLGGLQLFAAGIPGTGTKQPGQAGDLKPAGTNGTAGTVTEISMGNFDTEDSDEHELKKRSSLRLVAQKDGSVSLAFLSVAARSEEGNELKEIAYTQLVPLAVPDSREFVSQNSLPCPITDQSWSKQMAASLAKIGIQILPGENRENFYLQKGRLLFAVTRNTVIGTDHGVVALAAGSIAIVEADDESTIVCNLHDRQQGDVTFTRASHNIHVNLGRQLIISKADKAQAEFAKESGIAVRDVQTRALSNGYKSHLSEFSLTGALSSDQILKALSQSTNKSERKQFAQIAKNACIVGSLTIRKGPYKLD